MKPPRRILHVKGLETVFAELNQARIEYLVAGGMAVIAHGYARLTIDLDLVVAMRRPNLLAALQVLKRLGYVPAVPVVLEEFADEEKRRRWIDEKNMRVFQLITEQAGFPPIDLFAEEPFDFNEEAQRAQLVRISADVYVPVVCLQTLIRMKEQANRDKDQIDLKNLRLLSSGADDENQ